MPLRTRLGLVIGVVMFGLGTYVALHPLWSRESVTGQPFLDVVFAFFFLIKGWLYLRQARRPAPGPAGTGEQGEGGATGG